ncbi:hypothetical protein BHE74_00015857 [Ensete ventricosum]|nr:hypothetical protein BHE74_00015857 [Ensete ventricosum]
MIRMTTRSAYSLSGSGSSYSRCWTFRKNVSDLMAEISSSLHLLNGSDLAINGSRIWIIRLIRIVMSSLSNYSTVQIFRSMDLGYQNPRAKPSQFHSSRLFLRPEPGIISPAESVGVLRPCLLHLSCDFS